MTATYARAWYLCRVAPKARSRSQVRRFAAQERDGRRRGRPVKLWGPQIAFLRRWYDIDVGPWRSLPYPVATFRPNTDI